MKRLVARSTSAKDSSDLMGEVIANRRKLRPTHVERSVYGEGDGTGLVVHDTAIGRLGGLCCWEHLQPLSKYAMYSMDEQVHVASWPTRSLYAGKAFALGPEANLAASQVYALEGQCFVLEAGMNYLRDEGSDIGCYACRFMREQGPTGEIAPRTSGVAYFGDLEQLETWADSDPTHLKIMDKFLKYLEESNYQSGLTLWHEILIAPQGEHMCEYINCHGQTGFLPYVDVRSTTAMGHS